MLVATCDRALTCLLRPLLSRTPMSTRRTDPSQGITTQQHHYQCRLHHLIYRTYDSQTLAVSAFHFEQLGN